uniref:Uncharacterized protein n=1 Tax=Leersia perrieri TaxID=77586 RepID=A0A0D9WPA3_9ORYZ
MEAGDGEEAGVGNKKRKEPNAESESDVSTQPGERKKTILPTWRKYAVPCEGSEVLKKKKVAFAVKRLRTMMDVLGAVDFWLERQAEAKAKEEA